MRDDGQHARTDGPSGTGMVMRETRQIISPWVSLIGRDVRKSGSADPQTFHSIAQADYVTVLAVTADGRIPIVRQYRPAVDAWTLELPAGLVDTHETPVIAAAREVYEETGFRPAAAPVDLGRLMPDTGRLSNALWCFAATLENERVPSWHPEAGMECLLVDRRELKQMVVDGKLAHALHIAVIALAILRGAFAWDTE